MKRGRENVADPEARQVDHFRTTLLVKYLSSKLRLLFNVPSRFPASKFRRPCLFLCALLRHFSPIGLPGSVNLARHSLRIPLAAERRTLDDERTKDS